MYGTLLFVSDKKYKKEKVLQIIQLLNGELLSYKERYRIQPGDHVRFAGEEYVFY